MSLAIAQVVRTDPKTHGEQILSLSPSEELFEAVQALLGEPFDEDDLYGVYVTGVSLLETAAACYLTDPSYECTQRCEASDGPLCHFEAVGGNWATDNSVRNPDVGGGLWELPGAKSVFLLAGGFLGSWLPGPDVAGNPVWAWGGDRPSHAVTRFSRRGVSRLLRKSSISKLSINFIDRGRHEVHGF